MGIRNLTTAIRPYGEPRVLDADSRVVIDGPALAYHIIGLCSPRNGPTSPFAQPSYQVLADTTLAWLDELERKGPRVAAIYFDGHLPRHKVAERLERSLKVSRQLNNFFLSTPHGVAESSQSAPLNSKKLFSRSPKPSSSSWSAGTLPVPPLAVQAICDALRQSERYGRLTQLVPEEADCYCADSIRSNGGGVVLTSDSDLLVFDLGPNGSVVFLQDLELGSGADSEALLVQEYSPSKISERLGLPVLYDLSALAFELYLDPHLTEGKLLENARQATAIKESPKAYLSFMEQYRLFPLEDSSSGSAATPADICSMDSRVAELAVQYLKISSSGGSDTASLLEGADVEDENDSLLIFLPPLVDAWSRTSAWENGSFIRELAYRILRLGSSATLEPAEVREYRRLTSAASSGTHVTLPGADADDSIEEACAKLSALIGKIHGALALKEEDGNSSDLAWAVLSMQQEIKRSQETGKESLVLHILHRATDTSGAIRDCGTWDVLHMIAQLHATLYSLRILAQALDFAASRAQRDTVAATKDNCKSRLHAELRELSKTLSARLPPIADYCSVHDVAELPRRLRDAGGLELLRDLAGLSEPIPFGVSPARLVKKKRKRSAQIDPAQVADLKPKPPPVNKPVNRFSLLDALSTD